MKSIKSTDTEHTLELGRTTGKAVTTGISIALYGDLGAGKTTFVQGFARGLGVPENYYITSPTFNIINEYPAGELTLCHLDLYRLGSEEELDYIGFYDLVDESHLIIVEWPELLSEDGFHFDVTIRFKLDKDFSRTIEFDAPTQAGKNLLARFKN